MHPRPKRSLGQNFLRDPAISGRIVAALDLKVGDHVIEIGPGQGALTALLVKAGVDVTAIEFDSKLAPALRQRFASSGRITVIEADALEVAFNDLAHPTAKLVANLPYNISTPILQRLIEQRQCFSRLVLMFQKEVAERITATPGGKERGFLSVLAQNAFEIEYLFDVPQTAFYPVPKVWSAVIRLTPTPVTPHEPGFRELISMSFLQKRKTLTNNLSKSYPHVARTLELIGVAATARAEELTMEQWKALADEITK